MKLIRDDFGRHEDGERLVEEIGDVLEDGAVVRVDDDEERATSEGIQVARVKDVRMALNRTNARARRGRLACVAREEVGGRSDIARGEA